MRRLFYSNIAFWLWLTMLHCAITASNGVVIFTAWEQILKYPNVKQRLLHHKAYADKHGFTYTMFTAGHIPLAAAKDGILMVKLPALKMKSRGWIKVKAFEKLLQGYPKHDTFFYIDVDVTFYNFNVPITDVIAGYPQSVFAQIHTPTSVMSQSHSIVMRNTNDAHEFVQRWLAEGRVCQNINMEQGAFFATIARMFAQWRMNSNQTLTSEPFNCDKLVCLSGISAKNSKFNRCYADFMKNNNMPLYTPVIKLFPFTRQHVAPRDGFTVVTEYIAWNNSCPLTLHPMKNMSLIIGPSYNNCSRESA